MTMTREEQIAERYAHDELKDNHADIHKIVAAAFLNGIDYAEQHPQWISVEDELPKDGQTVLVVNKGLLPLAFISQYEDDGDGLTIKIYGIGLYFETKATHWMPCPPFEKGGEK